MPRSRRKQACSQRAARQGSGSSGANASGKIEHPCIDSERTIRRTLEKYAKLNTRGSTQRSREQKVEPTPLPPLPVPPFLPPSVSLLSFLAPHPPHTAMHVTAITSPHRHGLCCISIEQREKMLEHQEDTFELPLDARNSAQHLPPLAPMLLHGAARVARHGFMAEPNTCLQIALNL